MNPQPLQRLTLLAVLGLLCSGMVRGENPPPAWRLSEKPIRTLTGLDVPESVCFDPQTGHAYISNITTATEGYWAEDGQAFISRLKRNGALDARRWRESTPDQPLHAPKGLCILDGVLYVADINRVCCYPLQEGLSVPPQIPIAGAQRLNDMATDGQAVYASDTGASQIVRLDLSGKGQHALLPAPEMVNGITFHQGKMFGVSWSQHDVYELDPQGRQPPRAFGLAEHLKAPDGIEVLDDGHLIVSDFEGGKLLLIAPDHQQVWTLATLDSPADFGIDRHRGRLFVPQFFQKQVRIYRLIRENEENQP